MSSAARGGHTGTLRADRAAQGRIEKGETDGLTGRALRGDRQGRGQAPELLLRALRVGVRRYRRPDNYAVVPREGNTNADGAGIGGGVGTGPEGYDGHVPFYVEVPDVVAALEPSGDDAVPRIRCHGQHPAVAPVVLPHRRHAPVAERVVAVAARLEPDELEQAGPCEDDPPPRIEVHRRAALTDCGGPAALAERAVKAPTPPEAGDGVAVPIAGGALAIDHSAHVDPVAGVDHQVRGALERHVPPHLSVIAERAVEIAVGHEAGEGDVVVRAGPSDDDSAPGVAVDVGRSSAPRTAARRGSGVVIGDDFPAAPERAVERAVALQPNEDDVAARLLGAGPAGDQEAMVRNPLHPAREVVGTEVEAHLATAAERAVRLAVAHIANDGDVARVLVGAGEAGGDDPSPPAQQDRVRARPGVEGGVPDAVVIEGAVELTVGPQPHQLHRGTIRPLVAAEPGRDDPPAAADLNRSWIAADVLQVDLAGASERIIQRPRASGGRGRRQTHAADRYSEDDPMLGRHPSPLPAPTRGDLVSCGSS